MQSYVGQDAWKPFTVDLLDDLPEPLKSPYQSKFLRTIAPIGGKIDWDQPGSAAGNWFVQDTNGYLGVISNGTNSFPLILPSIQVNSDGTLTVEKAPQLKSKSEFKGFSATAKTYVH